jgi:hypothetical protein
MLGTNNLKVVLHVQDTHLYEKVFKIFKYLDHNLECREHTEEASRSPNLKSLSSFHLPYSPNVVGLRDLKSLIGII